MRRIYIFVLIGLFLGACNQDEQRNMPAPTDTVVRADMEEEGKRQAREAWFEQLHQAEDGIDWRSIEYQTSMEKHLRKSALRSGNLTRGGGDLVSVAGGKLEGRWYERGSDNQAGSVVATEYDVEEDILYLISAGGTLFKGTIDGLSWEVVNQDLRFGGNFLRIIDNNGQKRMVALVNRTPHYSDDMGLTWLPSEGISINDRWGNCYFARVSPSTGNIYVLSKPSYWTDQKIYVSTDNGESYEIFTELDSHDQGLYFLYNPPGSEKLLFIEKESGDTWSLSEINEAEGSLEELSMIDTVGFGGSRANLTGVHFDDETTLYIYNDDKDVWRTRDFGLTWTRQGKFSGSPWNVGMFVSPSNPNILLMGEVECFRSTNEGNRWQKINTWGEYYRDPYLKLHADMMYFNEFVDQDGEPFLLISNHGGLSISRNGGVKNENIGLYGLNVSQYYSVRTDPLDNDIIYAGAQDQGFQRGRSKDDKEWVEFDQIISGDYGHIVFTDSGQRMWTVYPGGSVSYYEFPHTNTRPTEGFNIDSEHESVWIPPLVAHPDASQNAIYMAGGSIDGGPGSFVIKAELDPQSNNIQLSQWDTDFQALSNDGRVGAIAFSPLNHDHVFVSTNNGLLYYSQDGGATFKKSIINVPGSHYLYGTSIVPSSTDINTVYVGGSGYSTDPVVVSRDGGRTFRPMRDELPSTVVFQLAIDEDEEVLYAATEAGPYAYIFEEGTWFDIGGIDAPNQTYWSVEYLKDRKLARFGTYGRGIWDFDIESVTTSTKEPANVAWKAIPNPAQEYVEITDGVRSLPVQIFDLNGRLISNTTFNGQRINIGNLTSGNYIIRHNGTTQKLIKQ